MSGPPDGRTAVLDIGSNSTRLLLHAAGGERREIEVTGLRRGAAADGTIAADALARLDSCLARFGERIRAFAPDRIVAVGTSAVREAPNRARVAEIVRARLGCRLIVVDGDTEAGLAFAGARLALADQEAPCAVLDIGGGSTELCRGGPAGPEAAVSVRLGSVRDTEAFLRSDPPAAAELSALAGDAQARLDDGIARIGGPAALAGLPLVGVAGTVTSIAAVLAGGYDPDRSHGSALSLADARAARDRLAALPLEERRRVPGLHPDRASAIVAGAVILVAALVVLGADGLVVSERDILDGALRAETIASVDSPAG